MLAITIGEVVVDWIATTAGADVLQIQNYCRAIGGNATNVAIGLSRLGANARLIGKVGRDLHGQLLLKMLEREGVDSQFVLQDENATTAQCYCLFNNDDQNFFYNWPRNNAAERLDVTEINDQQFAGGAILHATGISLHTAPRRTAIYKAIETAVRMGLIVSFDAGFPTGEDDEARTFADQALRLTHVLKVNAEELIFWTGGVATLKPPRSYIEECARVLFEKYEPLVLVVTLGKEGSMIKTSRQECFCPAFNVKSVSAVGAGDGYIAGMLKAIIERLIARSAGNATTKTAAERLGEITDMDWMEIARFASAVGALVTTHVGAADGMPSASAVKELLLAQPYLDK